MSVTLAYRQNLNKMKDNSNPEIVCTDTIANNRKLMLSDANISADEEYLLSTFYDLVSVIKDPEHNNTLEELKIVSPSSVSLSSTATLTQACLRAKRSSRWSGFRPSRTVHMRRRSPLRCGMTRSHTARNLSTSCLTTAAIRSTSSSETARTYRPKRVPSC